MITTPTTDAVLDAPGWMTPEPFSVRRTRRETADTVTLELEGGFGFRPGQFNMLYALGIGEVPISISGEHPHGGLLHTIRNVGAVTAALCGLRRGEALGVRGPFGTDWGVAEAEGADVLIVAGGIGLAPLRPAISRVLDRREAYGRVSVLYGARTPNDLLFRRELAAWRGRLDVDVEITVDAAGEGWRGNVGVVPALISRARFHPLDVLALVCGPEIMMRFTVQALVEAGVPTSQIMVSMERNMKCAVRQCGHCQLGPFFICDDGPVMRFDVVAPWFGLREM